MTTELIYLVLTMILASSLWIPYVIGVTRYPEQAGDAFARPATLSQLPDWVQRAHRAHLNILETAMPFAILVLLAQILNVSTMVTVIAAGAFFWLRVVHAAGMISGVIRFPVRPIIFTLSWLCTLAFAWQVLAHG